MHFFSTDLSSLFKPIVSQSHGCSSSNRMLASHTSIGFQVMAVIPLTELAALEEACIVFWKQKNSAKAFGTASCMNSKLWSDICGTQKSHSTFAHTCKTHTPYTRLLGNRMFTSTSTGCYQALCNLITIQYCNKVIFQPTMVVKLKATSIWSCLTLAICGPIWPWQYHHVHLNEFSITEFRWATHAIASKANTTCMNRLVFVQQWKMHYAHASARHVTNERHLDAILFYAFTNISRRTFSIARTTISHLQTNVHHTLNNFVIDLSGWSRSPSNTNSWRRFGCRSVWERAAASTKKATIIHWSSSNWSLLSTFTSSMSTLRSKRWNRYKFQGRTQENCPPPSK